MLFGVGEFFCSKLMKNYKIALLLVAISLTTKAQKYDFEQYILNNLTWKETATTKWEEIIKTSKGSLYYFGAYHLDNPSDKQFSEIKNRWNDFRPTIAFFEGPDRGIDTTAILTVQKFGESGYLRFLAKQAGVKTISLEPSPVALYTYLCGKFSQEQVDLYMLTKEAMRLRTRKELNKAQIEIELNKMLAMFTKMLGRELAITNLSRLGIVFNKTFGNKLEWWEAPIAWFDPQLKDDRFTNQLSLLSTNYRDVYMVAILTKYVNDGERVFAVVGRNHIPLQINAIKYAVNLPLNK
jgi:hypothetical protein